MAYYVFESISNIDIIAQAVRESTEEVTQESEFTSWHHVFIPLFSVASWYFCN